MKTNYSFVRSALRLIAVFLFAGPVADAQTLLTGDLAIVGVNRNTSPTELAIVALSKIPSGTKIYISDYPYSDTASGFVNTTNTSEGAIEWTTNSVISKGTVILITINGATSPATVGGLSGMGTVNVTGWTSGNVTSTPMPAGGDNWFIYQGTNATTPTKFIFGWTNYFVTTMGSANGWIANGMQVATNTSTSELPPGLTNGVNAISLSWSTASGGSHGDNNAYKGGASGIKTTLLTSICTVANWDHDETLTYKLTSTSNGTTQNSGNPYLGTFTVINSAPTASSVVHTGALEFDSTLTGSYVFADINNDPDSNSTFRWFRSDSASGVNKTVIASATAKTYRLTMADITKYISFEVTPSDGTTAGTPVESPLRGPITWILPVKLVSFSAKRSDSGIRLEWVVASEHNNREFRLYRTTPGGMQELIGTVAGKGNSALRSSYAFTDASPVKGYNQYLLEQADMDGKRTVLSSAGAEFQQASTSSVVIVYPNPTASTVTVKMLPGKFKAAVLLDANGKQLGTKNISGNETELSFDLSMLSAGSYVVRLSDGSVVEQMQIVKK